jgi:hypothetical protein
MALTLIGTIYKDRNTVEGSDPADNSDGTWTSLSAGDNGDGTWTASFTNNGDGTWTGT